MVDLEAQTNKHPDSYNIGNSDYAKHNIKPWDLWEEYGLNPWDADIVKRVLRIKKGEERKLDYQKIIHICQKRIEQIERGYIHPADHFKMMENRWNSNK